MAFEAAIFRVVAFGAKKLGVVAFEALILGVPACTLPGLTKEYTATVVRHKMANIKKKKHWFGFKDFWFISV